MDRFRSLVAQLDHLDDSPLEQDLWAELVVRGLDRYLQPQVEVYDAEGRYIVRVDFTSLPLGVAIFCDGWAHHSAPADVARDQEHNKRLASLGWVVRRYRTEEITDRREAVGDEIHELVCDRTGQMWLGKFWSSLGSEVRAPTRVALAARRRPQGA